MFHVFHVFHGGTWNTQKEAAFLLFRANVGFPIAGDGILGDDHVLSNDDYYESEAKSKCGSDDTIFHNWCLRALILFAIQMENTVWR